MARVKSPCGRDCGDRVLGCRSTCEKWAEYEKQKEAERAAKVADWKARDDVALVRAGAKKKLEHNRVVSLKKRK